LAAAVRIVGSSAREGESIGRRIVMKPHCGGGRIDHLDGISARVSVHDGVFPALLGVPVPMVNGHAHDPSILITAEVRERER
jgi:hypothetical protein